jgi:hypothetical protein
MGVIIGVPDGIKLVAAAATALACRLDRRISCRNAWEIGSADDNRGGIEREFLRY